MFYRLVGWPIFTQPDRVMGHHVNRPLFHQRGQADRRAAIIGKDQECAAIGNSPAMQGNAVHRGGHTMFAHPVMDVMASRILR